MRAQMSNIDDKMMMSWEQSKRLVESILILDTFSLVISILADQKF